MRGSSKVATAAGMVGANEYRAGQIDKILGRGEIAGGSFVRLPELEPVEYPEQVETYGARILRMYLAGEITEQQYLEWK